MIGIYFSGTGNSKHAVQLFCQEYDKDMKIFSIEDTAVIEMIRKNDIIIFSYPVQYSTLPTILREFVAKTKEVWQGKKVFVIATMALFSGDGAGVLGRSLKSCGAKLLGGLHVKMPDSIADEKVLWHSYEKNAEIIQKADIKIKRAVRLMKEGKPTQEGMRFGNRLAGFLVQRLFFGHITENYSNKLKIDVNKCVGCGMCERLCPTQNMYVLDGKAEHKDQCTRCYRCINHCPKQAITLCGKRVIKQNTIEKYT